jgi:hypothetical protein
MRPPRGHELPLAIHGGYAAPRRELYDPPAVGEEEGVRLHKQRAGAFSGKRGERLLETARVAGFKDRQL